MLKFIFNPKKMRLAILFMLLLNWSCTTNQPDNKLETSGVLLLKSGFEEGVEISNDMTRIIGSDVAGYDWEAIPSWSSSRFVYIVSAGKNLKDYAESFIEKTIGPKGNETSVLCLKNIADDPDHSATSRNEFSFFGEDPPDDFKEGYVRYWMKLQDNLDKMFSDRQDAPWYMVLEWKEPNSGISKSEEECKKCCNARRGGTNNYRINVHMEKDENSEVFYWVINGEHPQPCRVREWTYINNQEIVPFGEWFQVEAYLKKHESEGRVYFAVNSQVILDTHIVWPEGFTGRTQHNDNPMPLRFWSPMKNYHSMEWNKDGPICQWYDDFELWSSFPPGHPALNTKLIAQIP
jgi:hypothetical protein